MATIDTTIQPWQGHFYLDGWASGGRPLDVLDKATGERLAQVAQASPEDVDHAVSVATEAQRGWAATPGPSRRAVLIKFAALLEQQTDQLVGLLVREGGGVVAKAAFEVQMAGGEVLEAAAMCTLPIGEVLPASQPGVVSIARRVPRGVVGIISPWNFPLILGLRSIAPAIALGNAVVLKPDPQTPIVGGLLLAELLEEAGLPSGVFSVLPGDAEVGEAIVTHAGVKMVSFTGSTAVGRRIAQLAAPQLKKVALELGGNNALIVLEDANLEIASSNGAWGSFLHQGQICMTAGRHIVHRSVADEYIQRLTERADRLPYGDPASNPELAIGPLINAAAVTRVEDLVRRTVAQGARRTTSREADGPYFPPTVLADVTRDMPAFREEIFGPVAPVIIVDSDEEAAAVANDSEYGLVAAIQTGDADRGSALGDLLRAGMVHINDQTVNYESNSPFGGMGASGNGGRFGGAASLDEFTEWQWVTRRATASGYPF
jgi:benzaldehyde dehydrogenase (NAD)